MKYILNATNGLFWLPENVTLGVENKRYGEVVTRIDTLYPCNCDTNKDMKNIEELKKNEDFFYFRSVENSEVIRFWIRNEYKRMEYHGIELVDIDISRKWIIEEYDGVESLVYLDSFICIDKDINLYRLQK